MAHPASSDNPKPGFLNRIWRSIFPVSFGTDRDANRKRFFRNSLIFHFRPPTVKEKTLKLSLTWGLGGMAATLILLQLATGVLLKFIYIPTPVDAYESVRTIITQIPFGRLVRNIHHWSANFLVVVLMLHMLRVFFTGAFHPPRQFNWIIGLFLFGLVLAANLSGYLLPYDQLAYWAVTVIAAMAGYLPGIGYHLQRMLGNGSDLGPQTLPFFFSLHTAVIPFLLILLMAFHFWRIRKADGVVAPRRPGEDVDQKPSRVPAVPNLLVKEIALALTLTATILVFSIGLDAPFSEPANPGLSPEVVRAPWYFAGFQEILLHVHPSVAVSVVPLSIGIFLLTIPYFTYDTSTEGIWFASERGKRQTLLSALASLIFTPVLVVFDTTILKSSSWGLPISPALRNGVFPILLFLLLVTAILLFLRKKTGYTTGETIQILFVTQVTGFIVLTLVGVFFRGPSMQLIWPF